MLLERESLYLDPKTISRQQVIKLLQKLQDQMFPQRTKKQVEDTPKVIEKQISEESKKAISKPGPIKPTRDIMPISKDDYLTKYLEDDLRKKGGKEVDERERILSDMKSNGDSDSYITEEEQMRMI